MNAPSQRGMVGFLRHPTLPWVFGVVLGYGADADGDHLWPDDDPDEPLGRVGLDPPFLLLSDKHLRMA